MSDPFFSRPTTTALAGKQDCTVKTMVSDEFKEALTKRWRSLGYQSESDFVREALIVTVYGSDYLANLHRDRINALVRSGADSVPERSTST